MGTCPKCESPLVLEEDGRKLFMTCPCGCDGVRFRIKRRKLQVLDGEIDDWPSYGPD